MKEVYLLVKNGEHTYWNRAGVAFVNQDGSLNLKLDMFPALTFNIRDRKSDAAEPPQEQVKQNGSRNANRR